MQRSTIITIAAAALMLSSCSSNMSHTLTPSKETVTFQVPAKDIKSLEIFNNFKVTYTQGDICSVTVTTPVNLREELKIKVDGTTLTAALKDGVSLRGGNAIAINVTSPYINDINIANSSSLYIADGLSTPDYVKIGAENSATVSISSIDTREFKAEVFNSSDLSIGAITSVSTDMECFNSGAVNIEKLISDSIEAEIFNSSRVSLDGIATKTLKAECYNTSNLSLTGKADKTILESYNSARIDASGLKK